MSQTIMTVDDSASIRQMVCFSLAEAGYEVVEAVDGQDALGKLDARLKMIITDLNMPRMDGLELIRSVRSNASFKFLPIVMLTTESQESKKHEGKAAGATGWIIKPFKPEQIVGLVKKLLR